MVPLLLVGCSTSNNLEDRIQSQIQISCDAYETAVKGQDSPSGRDAIVQASSLARLDSGYLSYAAAITWDIAYGGNSKTYTREEILEGQKALTIIVGLCGK